VRELLLDSARTPNALAEAFLLEAARAELVARVIRPALEAGRVVLCDRYADSTLAYQGAGRGLDVALLESMNRAATGGIVPDITLLFDLDPEIGIERRAQAPGTLSRLDKEPLEFHRRVRDKFLELAHREPSRFVVLDATAPPELIEWKVWLAVDERLRQGAAWQQPKSGPRPTRN
jgi:dTMP kinase